MLKELQKTFICPKSGDIIASGEENCVELVKTGAVNKKDTKGCKLEQVQRGLK